MEGNDFILKRRKFLSSIGILGMAYVVPFKTIAQINAEKDPVNEIFEAGPYLQYFGKEEITVRWITKVPCFSWVEYGDAQNRLDKKAMSVNAGLVEAFNNIHAINIEGLKAGRKYYYRICSKKIEKFEPYDVVYGKTVKSDIFSFQKAQPNEDITFFVFNDIHDRPESFDQLISSSGNDNVDFMFFNGDIFNHLESEEQIIQNLLDPLELTSVHTPFVFSRGNHETRGKFARHLEKYFNHGKNGFYFSFQLGPVYCIVLDSGEDKPDDSQVYAGLVDFDAYRLTQREWLKKEIKKKEFKKAKYKIVFSHIPMFYSNDWHGPLHCRESWADVLNKAGIDLMVCGHTHKPGIHPKVTGLHNYPIVIGGGPKDGNRTIIKIEANNNTLQLTMYNDSGVKNGELTI